MSDLFPHRKEIEVIDVVDTFDISEVAEEISLEVAKNRPLKSGEYVILPNQGELEQIPGAIITNSSSPQIQEGYRTNPNQVCGQNTPAVYGVLADVCLFGPYQMVVLPDGRFLRESITLDRDHVLNNHFFAQKRQQHQVKPEKVDVPLFRATHHHSQNYGHFLRDSLTLGRVLDSFHFPNAIKSCVNGMETKFVHDLFSHFRPNDSYLINHGLAVETDQLHFVSQPPISSLAIDYIRANANRIVKSNRQNWQTVAQQIENCMPAIYVSRLGSRRAVQNEVELLPILKKYNIKPVTPHELTVTEQVLLFSSVHFLMGAWGASLCNSAFMPEHSIVLELCDPYRYKDRWYMDYISHSRCHYGKIVGEAPLGHQYRSWNDTQSDFVISPDLIDEVLSKLLGKSRKV